MKGFGIEIKNDLLDAKHIERMGVAVWLYMWCIDKMTSIDEEGVGKILGGKPIKFEEVGSELGISMRTYRRWISLLENSGYINVKTAPYGLIITVNKAHKRFGKRYAESGTSEEKEVGQERHTSIQNVAHLKTKNGTPNKTLQLDIPVNKAEEKLTPGEIAKGFFAGDPEICAPLAQKLTDAGVPADTVTRELLKFHRYWTEPTRNGKRTKWELQPTFDVRGRLGTWFRNIAERGGVKRAGAGVTL